LNYPEFEFKGTNFNDKLENFTFTKAIFFEQFKFFIGVILTICFFGCIASTFVSNFRVTFKNKLSTAFLSIIAWVIITVSILSITSFIYPNLFFSHKTWASPYLFLLISTTLTIALLLSFLIKKNRIKTLLIFLIVLLPNSIKIDTNTELKKNKLINNRNVIIIGIDSLNIDVIDSENTPFIHSFINESLYLPNTYTHVARTFPSWVSILTGDYPLSNKARLNLTNLDNLNLKETLPYFLKQHGYKTYFSLDERRFSHIDQSFYFDKIIGPPETVNELVLSQLVENPMLAITSQLSIFNYFMPQLYNNRGSWKNYFPDSFNEELEAKIKNEDRPVFISSHFTLPHWPYKSKYDTSDSKDTYGKYIDSVKLTDKQVHRYYEHLKSEGLLNNALVFLITDHGESFGREIDQPKNSNRSLNIPGHGNSIISNSQFNVLLTLKVYDQGKVIEKKIKNKNLKFALTDITPTIFDLLGLTPPKNFDGQSIFKVKNERSIPLESSLKPSFNIDGSVNLKDTIKNGLSLYDVNDLGRAVLKDTLYQDLVSLKQRGIIFTKWQVSIYPELNNSIFITDLENNYLYKFNDFKNKELANSLLKKLCSMFSDDDFDAKSKYCKNEPYLLVNGSMHGEAI
jgi:hypothetical protein